MWGLYKSTDGGATWTYIHGGSANAADCANADPALVAANATPCTPRGVRAGRARPVESRHRLLVLVRKRRLAVDRRGRDVDADQAVAELGDHDDAAVDCRHDAAERQDRACTSAKDIPAAPQRSTAASSAATTWRRDPRSGQDLTSCRHRLIRAGGRSTSAAASAGTTTSSTRPPGYPDIVYVGGSYAYGETVREPPRRRAVHRRRRRRGTDMTADETDSVHPNALHPDQHVLVTNPSNPFQFFEGERRRRDALERSARRVRRWCATAAG